MTQPVGRVMDAPPELAFWLRSSPIFCAGDMLYFLLRIVVDYLLEPTLSWRHFKAELAYRFRDEDWYQRPKEVEKSVMGRWVLIVLGGIPCQTIKLMAMRGIPLTQTWALLFFVALIFGEVLNVAAESIFRIHNGVSTETQDPSHSPTNAGNPFLRMTQVVGQVIFPTSSAEFAAERPGDAT
ncbi:hypothetical protein HIM_11592 [Hirsutella minnesotensis 3608]|uniref:Uncharacterized protein n=1 Tax=Hirsutella minnesotensis 3608 TaxID=1043627 RepID=A0A0F7ZWI2_9HYPO|nr:hypothetical protein HIM_11592 [Hirsutella minnesotensis 3608]